MIYKISFIIPKLGICSGIILFLFCLTSIDFTSFFTYFEEKDYIKTEAHSITWVEDIDENEKLYYKATYHYKVNDVELQCYGEISTSKVAVDKDIYYNPNNPKKCRTSKPNTDIKKIIKSEISSFVFIIFGAYISIKNIIKYKNNKKLANVGILVKGVLYEVCESNIYINKFPVFCFKVTYTFPNGETKTLKSHPIYNYNLEDADGKCDLLYDPNNYNNYYIALEIMTTGLGNPNIIQYNSTAQSQNTITYEEHKDNDSYHPGNKF